MEFTTIRRAVKAFVTDSSDLDRTPDLVNASGTVTFVPTLISGDVIQDIDENGRPVSIALTPIEVDIVDGLIYHEGEEGIRLVAGGQNSNPRVIRWKAGFKNMKAGSFSFDLKPVTFDAIPGGEVDLTLVAPVAGAPSALVRGEAGEDGITPHIENGNWWIGDTDTGVRAVGINDASGRGIVVVSSEMEAAALPIGTVYVIAEVALGEPTPVTIVGTVGENITTATFTPTIPNATTGDTIIIAANTKAVSGSTLTAPAGFTALVDGYYIGTQRSWVLTGPWSNDLTITADQPLEFAYAAVAVRGATSVTTGTVKDRTAAPTESTTVTALAVEHGTNDLAIGIAFERTSSTETPEQVTVNEGWTIEHYTAHGANFQTTLIGVGGTGDMVATYPNAQATNGSGVQVVAHA